MKRITIILLTVFLSTVSIYAKTLVVSPSSGNKMQITAVKTPSATLTIVPKAMPFYLTDAANEGGTEVATWSLESNTRNIRMEIEAPPLTSDEDPNVTIDYTLSFKSGDNLEDITANSWSEENTTVYSSFLSESEKDSIMSIGDQSVYLSLAEDVKISDSSYPVGSYRATVTITIEAGGEA